MTFECRLGSARLLDYRVRSYRGAARNALAQQGYWCWENQAVLNVIERLKKHNVSLVPTERSVFVGIDGQKVDAALPCIP